MKSTWDTVQDEVTSSLRKSKPTVVSPVSDHKSWNASCSDAYNIHWNTLRLLTLWNQLLGPTVYTLPRSVAESCLRRLAERMDPLAHIGHWENEEVHRGTSWFLDVFVSYASIMFWMFQVPLCRALIYFVFISWVPKLFVALVVWNSAKQMASLYPLSLSQRKLGSWNSTGARLACRATRSLSKKLAPTSTSKGTSCRCVYLSMICTPTHVCRCV